jgi:hypothetical protein
MADKLNGYPYQWKIWYEGDETFNSSQGTWKQAPGWGAQVITFLRPDLVEPKFGGRGWALAEGGAVFRKTQDGHIVACNQDALMDYVVNVLGIVKAGRMLSGAEYREILGNAHRELAEFAKQGFDKWERKP